MEIHDILKLAGGVLALSLFVPLILQAFKDGGAGQSFATWLLWACLDTTATLSLVQQHGNYLMPMSFAIGGIVTTLVLLYQGRYGWRRFDTVILLLVILCLVGWKLGGPKTATIAATLGICVAGIPGMVELWRTPNRRLGNIWGWYILATGLSFFGGTAMTVQERFAPGVFCLQSILLFAISRRRNLHSNVTCGVGKVN